MGGAQATITAATMDELKTKVEEWYAGAAAKGLENERLPWDPEMVQQTDDGYAFNVLAHT